jgi:hypothetical protein
MIGADWRRRVASSLLTTLLAAILLPLATERASAQQPDRGRRREFVEGLLQTLIDSQLPPQQTPPARVLPGQPRPPVHLPPAGNLAEIRSELDGFAAESRGLLTALQGDWSRAGLVGPLIGDTAKVHHAASALAGKYRQFHLRDVTPISEDYSTLNRDWRVLAHRIRQTRNLSRACYDRVDSLTERDRRLCQLLDVEPQLDGASLLRHTAALTVDLQNLGEDLESDLPPSPERNRLLALCRQTQQGAGEVTEAVFGDAVPDVTRQSYQRFRGDWSALAAALRPVENHYVQRTVRRVWRTDRVIHELLWIPYETDPGHVVFMAQILRGNIDALYDTVSLEDLIDLPPARQVLPTASEFYGLCEYFILCAEDEDSLEDLANAYWDLDAAWPGFLACFDSAQSTHVQQTLAEIEQSMSALRQLLGIPPAVDWELAQQRSSRLEYLAHELERSLESTKQSSSKYPSHVRSRIASAATKSQSFCTSCRSLNSKIVAKTNPKQLGPACTDVAQAWSSLQKGMITVFREEDVLRSTGEIARTLVELQTTFGP